MKVKALIIEIGIKNLHEIKRSLCPSCCELIYASSFLDVVDTIYLDNVHIIALSDFRGQKATIGYLKMFKTTNSNFKLIVLSNQKNLNDNYINYLIQRGASLVLSGYDILKLKKQIDKISYSFLKNQDTDNEWSECTKRAILFLKNNYHISKGIIDYLSNDINYSSSSIFHSIKKDTGKSVGTWIRELRIKGSIELLSSTDLPVKSISSQIGYSSIQGFIKTFKSITGKTPLEYKKLHL